MPFWKNGRRTSRLRPGCPKWGSVGRRAVSHGWVRRFDEDVSHLFEQVEVGIPVTVLP